MLSETLANELNENLKQFNSHFNKKPAVKPTTDEQLKEQARLSVEKHKAKMLLKNLKK